MQPWASLLVHGIKRVEGRSWPTDHRGRLWIASTAQEASPAVIQASDILFLNFCYTQIWLPYSSCQMWTCGAEMSD